jgi:hypothetical protein
MMIQVEHKFNKQQAGVLSSKALLNCTISIFRTISGQKSQERSGKVFRTANDGSLCLLLSLVRKSIGSQVGSLTLQEERSG